MEKNNPQKILNSVNKDPIVKILLKYSNLTDIQYESLIIDYLSYNISDIELTYEQKALLRSKKVSRGSYSRSLIQARKNIISSIYTILLLMYIGVYDLHPFDEYKNLSEKLSEYLTIIENNDPSIRRSVINRIEAELISGIESMALDKNLKPMWYHKTSH